MTKPNESRSDATEPPRETPLDKLARAEMDEGLYYREGETPPHPDDCNCHKCEPRSKRKLMKPAPTPEPRPSELKPLAIVDDRSIDAEDWLMEDRREDWEQELAKKREKAGTPETPPQVIPCPICGSTDPVACQGKPHADPTPYRRIAKAETPSALSAARWDSEREIDGHKYVLLGEVRSKLSTAERDYHRVLAACDKADEQREAAEAELARVRELILRADSMFSLIRHRAESRIPWGTTGFPELREADELISDLRKKEAALRTPEARIAPLTDGEPKEKS